MHEECEEHQSHIYRQSLFGIAAWLVVIYIVFLRNLACSCSNTNVGLAKPELTLGSNEYQHSYAFLND